MPRLKGETLEGYRTRLALKGVIAEKAGTNEGIRYLARAFGYDQMESLPAEDPARWAAARLGTACLIGREMTIRQV